MKFNRKLHFTERQRKPLSQQGEYKPCRSMIRNLERTEKLYPHSLATLRGIGNRANLGGHYDASR